jgi:ketosteroid isomerase-like protein
MEAGLHDLESHNLQIVKMLYRVCGRGDWAAAAQYLSADLVIREADTLPFAGVYRGPEGMRQLLAKVVQTAGVTGVELKHLTAGGDWVVALLDLLLEGSPPARVALAEAYRFRDRKVTEIVPYYFDPTPIVRAALKRRAGSEEALSVRAP